MTDQEPYIDESELPKIPWPNSWPDIALTALRHIISLIRPAIIAARNWPDGLECDGLSIASSNCLLARAEKSISNMPVLTISAGHSTNVWPDWLNHQN